jgi:hypothetical protein
MTKFATITTVAAVAVEFMASLTEAIPVLFCIKDAGDGRFVTARNRILRFRP